MAREDASHRQRHRGRKPPLKRAGQKLNMEPQFNRLAEQERDRSRRLKIILSVGLGPSLILAALGYYDAAGIAFFLSLVAGFLVVYVTERLDKLDVFLEAFETPRQRILLLAILLLYLGYLLSRTGWKELFDSF